MEASKQVYTSLVQPLFDYADAAWIHWPHSKAGQSERYKDGVKLETGGKKKEGETKDNVEKDRREGDERRRMGFVGRGAGRCGRQTDRQT